MWARRARRIRRRRGAASPARGRGDARVGARRRSRCHPLPSMSLANSVPAICSPSIARNQRLGIEVGPALQRQELLERAGWPLPHIGKGLFVRLECGLVVLVPGTKVRTAMPSGHSGCGGGSVEVDPHGVGDAHRRVAAGFQASESAACCSLTNARVTTRAPSGALRDCRGAAARPRRSRSRRVPVPQCAGWT